MKLKTTILLLLLMLVAASCGGGSDSSSDETTNGGETRLFSELETEAEGTTVRMFAYGGDDKTNAYLDDWLAPRLEEEYDITFERTPVGDTADVVNKLLNEKQAGDDEGTVDLAWINGQNFYTGSQADLWFGPFAERLPNAEYIDYEDRDIALDFGYPTDGYEAAWSQAQFVMVYDYAEVDDPPHTMEELRDWTADNPGRFTYPAPPDFFGNAFILQAFYDLTGDVETYGEPFDEQVFDERVGTFTEFMNDIEPDLWRGGETYPQTGAALDELFQNGEVDLTVTYNPYFAQQQVESGIFPETTRTYLLDGGTLSNTSYLAIPFNAPNSEGAQVAINFMESPEAQLELQKQNVVGGLATLDVESLPDDLQQDFAETAEGEAVLPLDELQANRLPEARTEWTLALQEAWTEDVQRD
ncbi:MAG: ABC transporter substrate-binding protein [Rubrobacter sp.]